MAHTLVWVRSTDAGALAELADLTLTLAAFGQPVTWLWCGDAPALLAAPSGRFATLLPMLADFGVRHAVSLETVAQLHLDDAELGAAEVLDPAALHALLADADHTLGWS